MTKKSDIKKLCEKQYADSKKEAKLYKCVPIDWLWMPKPIRNVVAMTTMIMFAGTFMSGMFIPLFFIPAVWRYAPNFCTVTAASFVISMMLPAREWKFGRKIGQLWYELLDFHANVDPEYVSFIYVTQLSYNVITIYIHIMFCVLTVYPIITIYLYHM